MFPTISAAICKDDQTHEKLKTAFNMADKLWDTLLAHEVCIIVKLLSGTELVNTRPVQEEQTPLPKRVQKGSTNDAASQVFVEPHETEFGQNQPLESFDEEKHMLGQLSVASQSKSDELANYTSEITDSTSVERVSTVSWCPDDYMADMANHGEGLVHEESLDLQEGLGFQEGLSHEVGLDHGEGLDYEEGLDHGEGLDYGEGLDHAEGLDHEEGLDHGEGLGLQEGLSHEVGLDHGEGLDHEEGLDFKEGLDHENCLDAEQSDEEDEIDYYQELEAKESRERRGTCSLIDANDQEINPQKNLHHEWQERCGRAQKLRDPKMKIVVVETSDKDNIGVMMDKGFLCRGIPRDQVEKVDMEFRLADLVVEFFLPHLDELLGLSVRGDPTSHTRQHPKMTITIYEDGDGCCTFISHVDKTFLTARDGPRTPENHKLLVRNLSTFVQERFFPQVMTRLWPTFWSDDHEFKVPREMDPAEVHINLTDAGQTEVQIKTWINTDIFEYAKTDDQQKVLTDRLQRFVDHELQSLLKSCLFPDIDSEERYEGENGNAMQTKNKQQKSDATMMELQEEVAFLKSLLKEKEMLLDSKNKGVLIYQKEEPQHKEEVHLLTMQQDVLKTLQDDLYAAHGLLRETDAMLKGNQDMISFLKLHQDITISEVSEKQSEIIDKTSLITSLQERLSASEKEEMMLNKIITDLRKKNHELTKTKGKQYQKLRRLKQRLEDAELATKKFQIQLVESNRLLKNVEVNSSLKDRVISRIKEDLGVSEERYDRLTQQAKKLYHSVKSTRKEKENLIKILDDLKKSKEQLEKSKSSEIEQLQSQITTLDGQVKTSTKEKSDLEKSQHLLEDLIADIQHQKKGLESNLMDKEKRLKMAEKTNIQLIKENLGSDAELKTLRKRKDESEKKLEVSRKWCDRKIEGIKQAGKQIDKLKSDFDCYINSQMEKKLTSMKQEIKLQHCLIDQLRDMLHKEEMKAARALHKVEKLKTQWSMKKASFLNMYKCERMVAEKRVKDFQNQIAKLTVEKEILGSQEFPATCVASSLKCHI